MGTHYPVQVANLSTDVSVVRLFRSGNTRSRSFLRCVFPWSGFHLLRPLGCSPAEAQSLRLFAAVAAAAGCVPRGQRALLDADMLELIDRSACLVEPVVVESCAPSVLVLSQQQARPAPRPVAARECPFPRGLVEDLLLPESSLRAAPIASLRLLLLDDRDLSLFCHVAKRFVTLFLDVLLHVLHLGSHPAC